MVPKILMKLAPLFRLSVWPYFKSWLPLDLTAELARARASVLVAQGTADLQVACKTCGTLPLRAPPPRWR